LIETLRARHETLKVQLNAAERAQDAQHAGKIAAELQEMTNKASAESFFELPTDSRGVHESALTAPGGAGSWDRQDATTSSAAHFAACAQQFSDR
jgi:hypothetical protein